LADPSVVDMLIEKKYKKNEWEIPKIAQIFLVHLFRLL
jgi:hypothetical protein